MFNFPWAFLSELFWFCASSCPEIKLLNSKKMKIHNFFDFLINTSHILYFANLILQLKKYIVRTKWSKMCYLNPLHFSGGGKNMIFKRWGGDIFFMQTVDPWNAIEYLFYTPFRDCGADLAHHVDTTGPQSLGEKNMDWYCNIKTFCYNQ